MEYFNLTSYLINATRQGQRILSVMTRCALMQLGNIMKLEHDTQDWSTGEIYKWQELKIQI